MPKYKYEAISQDGVPVSGVLEAYDEFEAIHEIKQSHQIVKSIKEVGGEKFGLHSNIGNPKIKEKVLALMCSQFAIVLRAGMPIVRAVELIADQTADRDLRKLLQQVAEDVSTGYGLAQSFENKGEKILPTSFIETVRSGEESGTMELAFQKLSVYFDRSAKTKDKVKSAMMYPIFLGVLAVLVIAVVMVIAMPVFMDMFADMDIALPLPTRILIGITEFFKAYWAIVLAAIVAVIIGLTVWGRYESGRMFYAQLRLKLPVLGSIELMKGSSQFSNTMNTMLTSGLNIVRAVHICSRVLDNYHLSTQLAKAVAGLEEGKSLGFCLEQCECFPELLVEMTSVGEQTGTLEETLDTIGEYYDSETAVASERALNALQPAITMVLGVFIGFIVIALYLPMFTMYAAM